MAEINVNDTIAKEREIGRKYAIKLRDHFKKQVSVLDKKTGMLSRPGYNVRIRNFYLQSISVKTLKYAFILHHGVDKNRKEHPMKTKTGKTVTVKTHPFKLQPKINIEIVEQLIEDLANEISEIRGDRILAEAGKSLERKQST